MFQKTLKFSTRLLNFLHFHLQKSRLLYKKPYKSPFENTNYHLNKLSTIKLTKFPHELVFLISAALIYDIFKGTFLSQCQSNNNNIINRQELDICKLIA